MTLEAMGRAFQEQSGAFQEQTNPTARHASRPPSSAPPHHTRRRWPRRQRRGGGQPGQAGQPRPRRPVAAGDEVGGSKPTQGTPCQAPLSGDAPKAWRPHGSALPPRTPVGTASPWPQLACPAGGERPRAPWPAGVPSGPYGPRVPATGALYRGAYRWSNRPTQQALGAGCGVPLRGGTVSQWAPAPTTVFAVPVEEARS